MQTKVVENEAAVIETLCHEIERLAKAAIESGSIFRVGLSGGSLTKYLSSGLPNITTDWSKWQLFFCDERFVPDNDPDSTFGVYKSNLLPKVELKEEQFVQINQSLGLDECAVDYQTKVLKSFGLAADSNDIPQFDLLLLGMGPDGHTCSLFPGHVLLTERKRLIAPIDDSPKPPPKRVTMTYALLDRAKNVIFAMAGAGKAEMVTRIIKNGEKFPAGMVVSQTEPLWILDQAAAVDLA